MKISNIYVGDAICNMLMIEAILRDKGMSVGRFKDIYRESPSQTFKCKVHDKNMFKPVWDETRLEQPKELQDFIDKVVSKHSAGHNKARAFVRPSGTEDILRLFVEAPSLEKLDAISNQILTEIDLTYRSAAQ